MILKRCAVSALYGIERIERNAADVVAVMRHRRERALQAGRRVVAEDEVQARIEVRAALLVERLEAIEPCRGARAGANADLEPDDLGRQLTARLEVAQQRPEVGHRVGDRLRMIGIR